MILMLLFPVLVTMLSFIFSSENIMQRSQVSKLCSCSFCAVSWVGVHVNQSGLSMVALFRRHFPSLHVCVRYMSSVMREQMIKALCKRSSLFQSMIELVQPTCVIIVMSTLPLLLRWVGHVEVSIVYFQATEAQKGRYLTSVNR